MLVAGAGFGSNCKLFLKVPLLSRRQRRIGLSRATIYKRIKEGSFPRQIPLGLRSAGWLESEINDWITERMNARRN